MLFAVALLIALVPLAITLLLPRRWLLLWMPALWAVIFLTIDGVRSLEGPLLVEILILLGPFVLTSSVTAAGRLMFVVAALDAELRRGYCD